MRRSRTNTGVGVRPVCKFGTSCYRRNPVHLEDEAHPADEDYLDCCTAASVQPEFVSIRKLFEWCDKAGTGKASRDSVGAVWDVIQRLGTDVGSIGDEWEKLDDDGNGYLNFSEFAEFTTRVGVGLPLGLDDLFGGSSNDKGVGLRCGVVGCACRSFIMRQARCKYGSECYQTNEDHRAHFLHPGDPGWEDSMIARDAHMCQCGHKQKLHASPLVGFKSITYPAYWQSEVSGEREFHALFELDQKFLPLFQGLVDGTYSDVTTRDRLNHSKTWMVPRGFQVTRIRRNENSKLWRKYKIKKGELLRERGLVDGDEALSSCGPQASVGSSLSRACTTSAMPEFGDYGDVLTTRVWEQLWEQHLDQAAEFGLSRTDMPDKRINEWFLFHGTSASASENICGHDFTMRLAGSATGTLYGRGTYLAESFTKADEYAKDERDVFVVMLCRVLGGRVRYCDERTPDAEVLMSDCTEGLYDCILGDRVKTSGTYREFVVFDTENVYPEYILEYTRGEFFKSPSHP